jgi:DNA-binding XRE family transcriptional regulator
MTETITREQSMTVLRKGGVPDPLIGAAFGISKQRVNMILGPHDEPAPKLAVKVEKEDVILSSGLPTWLKEYRYRLQWTQARAARELGTSLTTYASWEQGSGGCSLPYLLIRYLLLYERTTEQKKPEKSK